jgi:DUF1365 family protein
MVMQKSNKMNSAIYEGFVRHRRYTPKHHDFTYKVFMVYLDLQELDEVFSKTRLWSQSSFSLSWFRRKDYFDGDESTPLYDAIANAVESELGFRPEGKICMLANLRYFGYVMNPIVCYYCYDKTGEELQAVVAEVTNTPWKNRCHYVLDMKNNNNSPVLFDKKMHVSPFQPMGLVYQWQGKAPDKNLAIHFDVFSENEKARYAKSDIVFDASLVMKRREMTASAMRSVILLYPLMTMKVFGAIYWQALKLWFKKIPFFDHPNTTSDMRIFIGDKNESS